MYAIGGSAGPTINSQGNRFLAPNGKYNKEVSWSLIFYLGCVEVVYKYNFLEYYCAHLCFCFLKKNASVDDGDDH